MLCSPRVRVVSTVGAGSIFLFFGILALTFVPSFVDREVLDRDWLGYTEVSGSKELNEMTKQWMNPPYDMTLEIYMFSVINANDVMKGAKPILKETGPYTFVENQSKAANFSEDGKRVIYYNKRQYLFNSSLSCDSCSLDNKVIIPNIIFQKLVEMATTWLKKLLIEGVLKAFTRETAFFEVTVRQALFDGYEDPILSAICNKPLFGPICVSAKIPKRIGFFYGQNNTNDGAYEVSTGLGEPGNIGKIYTWNNMSVMPNGSWDSPYARMMNGTDGQLFPPMIQKGETLTIFAALAGRSIWMDYAGVSSYHGIPAYRFVIPSSMFDPSVERNRDFCNKDTPEFFNSSIQIPGCLPKGFIDVGRNQPGTPKVYLSQGHLFDAEKEVIDKIEGMKPGNSKNDTTVVDIEPTTGVVIRARRAMQINVAMLKGNLDILSKTSNMIVPVLWMNETVTFDEGTRRQLDQLILAKHVSFIVGVALVLTGAIIWVGLAAVLLIFSFNKDASEETQPIVEAEQQEATE